MKKTILILVTVSVSLFATGQTLSPNAKLLFKNVKCSLTVSEKNIVANQSNVKVSKDGKRFEIEEATDVSYDASVYVKDINNDKIDEVFVIQSSSWFGNSGGSTTIFIKLKGKYKIVCDLIGGIPMLLSTTSFGYPDLTFAMPGMTQPIWKFNGNEYDFFKSVGENEMSKLNPIDFIVDDETAEVVVPKKVEELTTEASELFKDCKTKFDATQKNQITQLCNYKELTKMKNVKLKALPADLNNDGIEEMFIHVFTKLLGIGSNEYFLFIQDANGNLTQVVSPLRLTMRMVDTKFNGFPLMLTGKVGFDRDLYKWNGITYELAKKLNSIEASKLQQLTIESVSESYTKTISN